MASETISRKDFMNVAKTFHNSGEDRFDDPTGESEPQGQSATNSSPEPQRKSHSVLRSFGTVTGLTMLSRVLGLVRTIGMASLFGTSLYSDSFLIAWTIPNLFRRLCGEGALASAFIPVYVKERRESFAAGTQLVNATLTRLSLILFAIVIVGELFLATTNTIGLISIAPIVVELSQILLPYLWFICLAGLLFGVLQSEGDFARPALAAVLLNVVWVSALGLAMVFFDSKLSQIRWLAAMLLFGGSCQLALQLYGCRKANVPFAPTLKSSPALSTVFWNYLPIAFGMSIEQINVFLDRMIAWQCVESQGGVSALYYSMRLIHLPIALLTTALITVLYPMFARLIADGQHELLKQRIAHALKVTLFLTIPAGFGLAVIGPEIVELMFERGQFNHDSTLRTARCICYYAPAVAIMSVNMLLIRVFQADQDTKTPARVGAIAVCINLVLNLILVQFLQEAGLALATTTSALFSLITLGLLSKHIKLKAVTATAVRCIALSILFSVACRALIATAVLPLSLNVVACIGLSAALYGGLAIFLKFPEVKLFFELRKMRSGG